MRIMLLPLILSLTLVTVVNAQPFDANMARADSLLTEVEAGLNAITPQDVATFNNLSGKATEAGELLVASTTQTHPNFAVLVARWGAVRDSMAAMAADWTAQSSAAAAAQNSGRASAGSTTESAGEELNRMIAKYLAANRPVLAEDASPDQARQWATEYMALTVTHPQADLLRVEQMVTAGEVSPEDAQRFATLVESQFRSEMLAEIAAERQRLDSLVFEAKILGELVLEIATDDNVRAYNFAGPTNGERNQQAMDAGFASVANARIIDEIVDGETTNDRQAEYQLISAAHKRFASLVTQARLGEAELAAAPVARPNQRAEILPSVVQEFWLNGSVIGEVDAKGGIWVDSRQVGDITNTGVIWINSYDKGSIEADGSVWYEGTQLGSLEPNGEVWVESRHVGTIDNEGNVWIGGSSRGSIEPFLGEWKRAAIVYFFGIF